MEQKNNINLLYEKREYHSSVERPTGKQMVVTIFFGVLGGSLGSVLTLFLTLVLGLIFMGLAGYIGILLTALSFIGMLIGVYFSGKYFYKNMTDSIQLRRIFMIALLSSYVLVTLWFLVI